MASLPLPSAPGASGTLGIETPILPLQYRLRRALSRHVPVTIVTRLVSQSKLVHFCLHGCFALRILQTVWKISRHHAVKIATPDQKSATRLHRKFRNVGYLPRRVIASCDKVIIPKSRFVSEWQKRMGNYPHNFLPTALIIPAFFPPPPLIFYNPLHSILLQRNLWGN